MSVHFDFEKLEELSKGIGLSQIQFIFDTFISEMTEFLKLQPLYKDIKIVLIHEYNSTKEVNVSVLDFGVEKIIQRNKLIMKLFDKDIKFFPFILLREAFYSFVPQKVSKLVKICINQIVENYLNKLSVLKDWKNLIRENLVDGDLVFPQFEKLQKFFKIDARDPVENSIQFFFKEMRENISLSQNNNNNNFYDIIFERYTYKTSKSIFNSDIIETLWLIIQLFYRKKSYLSISDYQTLFKITKENQQLNSNLSFRKFSENFKWINKSSYIAPSYDIYNNAIDLHTIIGIIKFNPLLERNKIKTLIEQWPFYHSPKFSENRFGIDISAIFIFPSVYLKDFINYFVKLAESGYIIYRKFYSVSSKTSQINLNYFTDFSNTKRIIEPESIKYEEKYEIETKIKYLIPSSTFSLSVFDFFLLDRVRNVSVVGLTFDKRIETLNAIKEDIENEVRKQRNFNKGFKDNLNKIIRYQSQFLKFLEKNKRKGLLYTHSQLNEILKYIDLVEIILTDHPEISNTYQLQKFIDNEALSQNIEEQIIIGNEKIKKICFRDFFSRYFQSKNLFREEIDKFQIFFDLLTVCNNLKILDINKIIKIVKNPQLVEKIYQKRKKRYESVFKPVSLYKITNERIYSVIETLLTLESPVLKPWLINTIFTSTFAKYYLELILKETTKVYMILGKLKRYFPRMFIYKIKELNSKEEFINISTYFLNIKEKKRFLEILYTNFESSIVSIKRYFWRGVIRLTKHNPRDFYEFENRQFFYSEDFFKQLLIYSQKILGDKLDWVEDAPNNNDFESFWSGNQNMDSLVRTVNKRISHQDLNFELKELGDLSDFNVNLKRYLVDQVQYLNIKSKKFFEKYVNSIKFLPTLQRFGFSQYNLYIRPFFYNSSSFRMDFRLLFINSFQKIKYPACFELDQAIFSEYIFPFRTPNKSYLNWLVKSKKNVSEYCLFYKKKYHDVLHFNRNLRKEGWEYSSIRFKSYMQDILFKPNYDPKISEIREFDLNEKFKSDIYGLGTQEYEDLIRIYNIDSIDIKLVLGTRQYSKINNITELLKKKLIIPYISLKNLEFQDKISIILPDTKREFNDNIIKIFSFFNVCRIYEIEGEFFIFGFQQEKVFENGFLIEIWFPKCELDEFFNVFDLLFQYLEIKHYIILTDLVNGKTLLKSVYGNLDFLQEYNPLLNLIWNDKDKIWMNHKLFNEKFEPIYPDLIKKDKQ
ncbi:MAG: hypothetical protein ACFFAI_09085 [Promethearchaeota archaeon]